MAEQMPEQLRLGIWIMRGCGLRIGECLAVRREDFLPDGTLRVTRQQLTDGTRGPLKARKAGEYRDTHA